MQPCMHSPAKGNPRRGEGETDARCSLNGHEIGRVDATYASHFKEKDPQSFPDASPAERAAWKLGEKELVICFSELWLGPFVIGDYFNVSPIGRFVWKIARVIGYYLVVNHSSYE